MLPLGLVLWFVSVVFGRVLMVLSLKGIVLLCCDLSDWSLILKS